MDAARSLLMSGYGLDNAVVFPHYGVVALWAIWLWTL